MASERFDPSDDRWQAQVAQLVAELRRDVGGVGHRVAPRPGTKGGLGTVVVSLGSAGLFTAAVEVIKAFVNRDAGRSVRLSWHPSGQLESFEVSASGVDEAVMQQVTGVLARQASRAGEVE